MSAAAAEDHDSMRIQPWPVGGRFARRPLPTARSATARSASGAAERPARGEGEMRPTHCAWDLTRRRMGNYGKAECLRCVCNTNN